MLLTLTCLIGLLGLVRVSAEPLIEGRVRLESGEPVADAQVRIFDLSDLRQGAIARALTNGTGYFALPLATLTGRALPERFALGPNYPNPFNPSTIIPYQLAASSEVRLEVFNLLGQRIATLVDGERVAGFHTATWTATDGAGRAVGAGVYIYRMTVGVESQTGRMVLIDGQAGVSAAGAASVLSGASGGSGPDGEGAQVYGLIVSGRGLVPYMDSAFRVEAGMAPVELVVSAGQYSAGKVTDDDEQAVIPDAKLRAAIAAALGKASGETITKGEMETLTILVAKTADISDLTGLEFATNLTLLVLDNNRITEVSALLGLTNLRILNLKGNPLSAASINDHIPALQARGVTVQFDPTPIDDPTPVTIPDATLRAVIAAALGKARGATITKSEMETLGRLNAQDVGISDLTGLEFATNLNSLYLWNNRITDLSPLAGLTNLNSLYLYNNSITDVSPLAGLTNLTFLSIKGNPLSASSINEHIPALQARGVTVQFDPPPTVIDDPTPVTIPDATLRAVIAATLGKASGATITKSEMETLGRLNAAAGISDLTGLEFATNLTNLRLSNNRITNLSPLSGLTKLTNLDLWNNQITDLSPLADLTNLTRLVLDNNRITDLSTLADLTNLNSLELNNNQIADLSPLSGLTKLTRLVLDNNQITDLSTLADLTNLNSLELNNNQIADLSPLSGLTKLRILSIVNNQITDLSPLTGLTNLNSLGLNNNHLSASSINDHIPALQAQGVAVQFDPTPYDPTPITIPDATLRAAIAAALGKASGATITKSEMTTLFTLEATDAGIRNVTGLEFATNLTKLVLDGNTVWTDSALKGLTALSGLTNLTELDLSGNNLTDLSALSGLTNLKKLHLYFNKLKNVSALRDLTNLEHLDLSGNNLTDLSALSGLTNLKKLHLYFNKLKNVSALRDLTNLEHLDLSGNNLTSLSAFSDLTNLRVLYLGGNNLKNSALSGLTNLTNLTNLGLGHNNLTNISALRGLTNLSWLWLSGNNLKDVSKLASVLSGFDNLGWLALGSNNIKDISKLIPSIHTGLTHLWLDGNDIKDISPLRRLTNLEWLWIEQNNITDISVLSGLTNLGGVGLGYNNISDISALSDLNLTGKLVLEANNISDISALSGLTDLKELWLGSNNIRDMSALSGLTNLERLDLLRNPLGASSINNHIPRLQAQGVKVRFNPNPFRGSDFDIEFVFLDPFTDSQKNVFPIVARRWTWVITEDLPDYELTRGWSGQCGDQSFEIPAGERIDDLRIYVTSFDSDDFPGIAGRGGPNLLRDNTHLPVLGCIDLAKGANDITILHEIGHVLGFGPVWDDLGLYQNPPDGDEHFNGPLAIAAFNDAGGWNYTGKKGAVGEFGTLEEFCVPGRTDELWRRTVPERDHSSVLGRSRLRCRCHAGRRLYPARCRIRKGQCKDRGGLALHC